MLPETDDGQKRIKKYLLENVTPEVNSIPKKDDKKPDRPEKDEDGTTIEYYDSKNGDDSNW